MLQLRFTCLLCFAVFAAFLATSAVHAHHGWAWASDEEFEITGVIQSVRLGNPHGRVTITVDGEEWVVEVGQPWRNDRVGLTKEMLSPGREITVHGHRAAEEDMRKVKAERVVIDGKDYNLYPGRDS
ncbi:hypothetical protein SAMN05216203_1285 [Marinobacter daqiaonensis]|uniref:DUF5666 domain-containing protein n=1 Tax=Marinobacter daqiaonensis TaxID=650891 RepID=A0A1I6HJ87_9GAMM|nr:DUF6152 family protein [Marinobacter daqiaonensis]SFR54466.1 hypothetical protein SAMN05216203_1285 [Marinobacter daqiaonensis]